MPEGKTIIKLTDVSKVYKMGGEEVYASKDINLEIHEGEFVVIMGPSGSGKSTIMNIIGCLDRPTGGSYLLDGREVSRLSDDELAVVRNQKIGFIFQKFYLLSGLTIRENVELPMIYAGVDTQERHDASKKHLTSVGLGDRMSHTSQEISGGQMQRVAIARSLVNKPALLLADEPTGNLDSKSGSEVMALFQKLHRKGTTIVLITHNPEVAKFGTRYVQLKDGTIVSDELVQERVMLSSGEDTSRSLTGRLHMMGRMNVSQSFKIAWNALIANKMRSLLTMLGIIIGVAAVIVMTSIGEGTRQGVMNQIYSMGSNIIYVSPGKGDSVIQNTISSETRLLTMKDVDMIKNKCGLLVKSVAPQISTSVTAIYMGNNLQTSLIGTTPDFLSVRNFSLKKGRMFDERDMASTAAVCVLGSYVSDKLFGKDGEAVGKTIKVSLSSDASEAPITVRLTVIGVLEKKGQTFGQDNDKQILIPVATLTERLVNMKDISIIFVEAVSADKVQDARNAITRALLPLHGNEPKNLDIQGQDEILKQVEATMAAFTFMLGGIAFVSLLVGGIGIMNIMLVSVTERTREIGIRKAIGARKNDILFQFLVESLVMSITGGIIGIGIGMGMSNLYTMATATSSLNMLSQTFISPESILLAFSFSAIVGIFFGLYPARRAASLDPIDALRYE